MQSALERRRRDREMRRRRHDDAHRVDRVEQRLERRERFDAELGRHLRRARRDRLVEADELRAGNVAQNARMMKPECARADHSDADGHQTTDPRSLRSKNARNS